ncbi:MAG: hypothetical protein HQL54_04480 [Magnetococcales bacterium]|nr:hypothetical protein [Magnetococcales bacterium]
MNNTQQPGSNETAELSPEHPIKPKKSSSKTVGQPTRAKPDIGLDKYYDPATGRYNWEAHTRELTFNQQRNEKNIQTAEPGEMHMSDADILTRANLDIEDLSQQLNTQGDFSEETYIALNQQGLPTELVADYAHAVRSRMEGETNKAVEYAGGPEQMNQLMAWAESTLDLDEKAKFSQMLQSPDWRDAIDLLQKRMADASPTNGEGALTSGSVINPQPIGYRSREEMKRDMRDNRYWKDPSYRSQVMQRVRFSQFDLD